MSVEREYGVPETETTRKSDLTTKDQLRMSLDSKDKSTVRTSLRGILLPPQYPTVPGSSVVGVMVGH